MKKHQDVFQKDEELFIKRLDKLFKTFYLLVKYRLYHVEQTGLPLLQK